MYSMCKKFRLGAGIQCSSLTNLSAGYPVPVMILGTNCFFRIGGGGSED